MNRPMLEEYKIKEINGEQVDGIHIYDYCRYFLDLEKYCDELEIKIKLKEHQRQNWEHDYNGIESYYKDCLAQREKVLIEWSDECHEAWCELDKYKRALDKACEELSQWFETRFRPIPKDKYTNRLTKEEWKELLLKDE